MPMYIHYSETLCAYIPAYECMYLQILTTIFEFPQRRNRFRVRVQPVNNNNKFQFHIMRTRLFDAECTVDGREAKPANTK